MTLRAAHGWNAQFPNVPPNKHPIEVARHEQRVTSLFAEFKTASSDFS
jgi:hypothetical protein